MAHRMLTHEVRWPMFGYRNVFLVLFALASANPAHSQDRPQPAKSAQSESSPDSHGGLCADYGRDVGTPVRGRTVEPGLLVHRVAPKYPKAARKAHIEGTVVVCAVIGKDGKVTNPLVVSGPSALTPSVIDAVRQWVYKPYLVGGEPIDVTTEIHVDFNSK